jgi:tetratricopeptide (TPR) repeat protein
MASDPSRARAELRQAAARDGLFGPAADTLSTSLDLAALEADRAKQLILIGRGLGLVGEWALAQDAFNQAVNQDPRNAQAWAWLGEAIQHNGLDGGGYVDRALALDGADPLIHALRGLYWKRRGDIARELAEFKQAALLDPKNPERQAALGEAYAATGDLVSALASYQNATAMAPEDPAYWRQLAMFCADSGVQVLEIGLPAARKAVQLAPDDPQAQDALGWSYAQAGYLYNAQQALVKASALAPDLALAHLHLAETYLRAGNREAALQELNQVRRIDADGPTGEVAAQLLRQYFP